MNFSLYSEFNSKILGGHFFNFINISYNKSTQFKFYFCFFENLKQVENIFDLSREKMLYEIRFRKSTFFFIGKCLFLI